jgi:hypothetical protein
MRLNELLEIELTTPDTHKTRQMVAMGLLVASKRKIRRACLSSEEPQFQQQQNKTARSAVTW